MQSNREARSDQRLRPLESAVSRARLALLWEEIWPRLAPLLSLVGLYVALSWLGFWRISGEYVRAAVLAIFALALAWALFRLLRIRMPGRAAAMDRVERHSRLPHRPARGLDDVLSPVARDAAAQALWLAHRERLFASLRNLTAGPPRPDLVRRDPNALRFVVPVLLAVALPVAWGEWGARLGEGFAPIATPAAPASARIDAWIDPPAYTRSAPIFLSRLDPAAPGQVVSVPEGSKLTVRIVSRQPATVELRTDAETAAVPAAEETGPAEGEVIRSHNATLERDAEIRISDAGGVTSYSVAVIEDRPPTVERAPIEINRSGSFTLPFAAKDDYGVTEGSVTFRPQRPPADGARPLVDAPKLPMRIDHTRPTDGVARVDGRLEEHPFAGMDVTADAVVLDAAGQEGRPADAGAMVLPARPFGHPIARALIEQRRELALDANNRDRVTHALDALAIAPERFVKDTDIYLGLRIGYHRMLEARTDDDLREMLDYLWAMARAIEDGDMSEAEQRLNAAREALEKALEEGASEEEIARLTEELRQAMQEFLRSYMAEMQRRGMENMPAMSDQEMQMLSEQDLNEMLDRIEELAKLGNKDAAQQLLSELQQMLDNLQMAMPGQMQDGQQGQMMQQLEELARMMQEQQRLMDETFQLDQGRRPGQRGQNQDQRPLTESEIDELMRQLEQGQSDLQEQLQALLEQLQQQGQPGEGQQQGEGEGEGQQPGEGRGQGQGQGALGRADRAMGDASRSLGQSQSGDAYQYQSDALQAMRDGMQGMMQQMQQMLGNSPNGMPQQTGRGRRPGTDPLGRPNNRAEGPDLGQNVEIPDEIDVERARRILNAIRERLGERYRPRFELDYLERLLRTE